MDNKSIGKRISLARKEKKITGEQLSEACNINATYLRQIESGLKTPSLPVFVTLCNELDVSPDYLLHDLLKNPYSSGADLICDLYDNATPKEITLITAMIRCALDHLE